MLKIQCRICGKKGLIPQIPEGTVDTLCEDCFLKVKEAYLSKRNEISWQALPDREDKKGN